MQMHVGAVKEGIALANHGDAAAFIEMTGDCLRALVVEVVQRAAISRCALGNLRRYRIAQLELGNVRRQIFFDNGARAAAIAILGEMRDDVSLFQCSHSFNGEQFGIAGTDADADQLARCLLDRVDHVSLLARALTAAAVMALPPRRPRTIRNGTPRGFSASASFASAAPTKPTGMPIMAAGLGAPASSSSSR